MDTDVREMRRRIETFLTSLLPLFQRTEQRIGACQYVCGLLLDGGRKNAAQIALRCGGRDQNIAHFVNQSPWPWTPIRRALALRMQADAPAVDAAWGIDDTGFPKKGAHSVGVAHQYSGTLQRIGNCQVAVTVNYLTDQGSFPLEVALYLPEAWATDTARRATVGVPETVTFRHKWALALDLLDQVRAWGLPDRVVLADADYGKVTDFRRGLRERGLSYALAVPKDTQVWTTAVTPLPPAAKGRKATKPQWPDALRVETVAQALPKSAWHTVTWRDGSKGKLTSRFAAVRVWPAHDTQAGQAAEPESWLVIEWPRGAAAPTGYWLSNLSSSSTIRVLVRWAKRRRWVEQNYQELKEEIGLDHFEGRSWQGWHHHVTLTMLAYAFLVAERYREKKRSRLAAPPDTPGVPSRPPPISGRLSNV